MMAFVKLEKKLTAEGSRIVRTRRKFDMGVVAGAAAAELSLSSKRSDASGLSTELVSSTG
jgi:hypothetical protein